jgi:hypothetical protein
MIIPKLAKDLHSAQNGLNSFIKEQEESITKYSDPMTFFEKNEPHNLLYSTFSYVADPTLTDKVYQIYYQTFYTLQSQLLIRGEHTKKHLDSMKKRIRSLPTGIYSNQTTGSDFIELFEVEFHNAETQNELRSIEKSYVSTTMQKSRDILDQLTNEYESHIGSEVDMWTKKRTQEQMIFVGFKIADAPCQWDKRRIGILFLDESEDEILLYDTQRIRAIWS